MFGRTAAVFGALLFAVTIDFGCSAASAMERCNDDEDWDRVIRACTAMIRSGRTDSYPYVFRGNAYLAKHQYDNAIQDYSRVVSLQPEDVYALTKRGLAYKGSGDYDRALADLDKAISITPTNGYLYNTRGEIYVAKIDYDRAIADFNQAVTRNPEVTRFRANREDAEKHRSGGVSTATNATINPGDYNDCTASDVVRSIAACTRIARDPAQPVADRVVAYRWLANGHMSTNAFADAVNDLSKAIELDSRNATLFATRAIANLAKSDRSAAAADYRQAVAIDPAKTAAIAASYTELQSLGAQ